MNTISNIDFSKRDYNGLLILNESFNDFRLHILRGYSSIRSADQIRTFQILYTYRDMVIFNCHICDVNNDVYFNLINNWIALYKSNSSSLIIANIVQIIYKFSFTHNKTMQMPFNQIISTAYQNGLLDGCQNKNPNLL